jgi:hypothetical protein
MTFGRWLLVHSFSIFLVCLLLLGYWFRDELQLQQAYQQLLNLERPEVRKEPAISNSVNNSDKIATSVTTTTSVNPIPQPEPQTTQNAHEEESKAVTIGETEALAIQSKPTVSEQVYEQDTLLYKARKAFWDKEFQKSISLYKDLINQHKHNPDYLGEMGNVYYAMNDFEHASQVFYQTARVLVEKGQYEQAWQLVSPVTAMNRELGEDLRQTLSH